MTNDMTTEEIAMVLNDLHNERNPNYKSRVCFRGRTFYLLPYVLRPDISETTKILAEHIPSLSEACTLDIGCGSGALTYILFN